MSRTTGALPRWPLVTVDIDGTLTTIHGWRVIAESFGRVPAFEQTNRRFYAKQVGEDEHLRAMLEIAAGHSVAEVEAALRATPRIDGIADGIRVLQDHGSRVALLTHNPPYVCDWYRRAFGFDDYEGVPQEVVNGIIQPPRSVRADKPEALRALTSRFGVRFSGVVHVGDGWADAALFPKVGAGVALNSRLPEVDRAADLVLHTHDFREVVAAIERLGPRP